MLSPLTWMVGPTMNLISGVHHLYERRKHAFMVLREYTIISHHNPCYSNHKINLKQRKVKKKFNPNPKLNLQRKTQQLRTQNQTFNKNTHQPKPKLKPRLSPLPWRACYCHERGEKRVLENYGKGKDKKIMKRKDCGRGSREKMWFCEIKKRKKKKRVRYYVVGVKSEWERKLPSLQISLQYDLITKES